MNSPLFGNLINQPSLAKSANSQFQYQMDLGTLNFNVSWNDRRFISTGDHDRSLQGGLNYTHRLAADWSADIGASYGRTFSSPIFGESEFVTGEISLIYQLNSTWQARGGYAYLHSHVNSPLSRPRCRKISRSCRCKRASDSGRKEAICRLPLLS